MKKAYIFRVILLFIGILVLIIPALNQDLKNSRFDRLSSENIKLVKGLSQNWIYSIVQDKYGYIWFGTWDGLNQYDGYNFTNYNVADGLSDHTIYSMIEGADGNLWIGTDNGLNKFDRKNRQFVQIKDESSDSSGRYYNRILHVLQSNDSTIWLGTGAGLKKYNQKTGKYTKYLSSTQEYFSPRSNYILHLYEDDKGTIWASSTYGLIIFDPTTERSTRYYHVPGDSTSLSHDNIRCVIQERSGNFWIGTRYGLNYYDTTTQKIKRYFNKPNDANSLADNWIRIIYEDKAGNIWIGTDEGGLCLYNKSDDQFIRFDNKVDDNYSLSNNRVYSILEDFAGNLWVGTYNGVNSTNKYANNFHHIQQSLSETTGLNSNFIWDFFEDQNNDLWIATSNGVNILNRKTGQYTQMSFDPDNKNSLNSNEVRSMLYSPETNSIWFGLYGTGVDRYDLVEKEFKHFVPEARKNSLGDSYISDLTISSDGRIWISTSRGLNCLDPESNNFIVFNNLSDDSTSISNDICYTTYEDRDGNLWIGTDNGLNKYLIKEDRFIRYFYGSENHLQANTFFCITEDKTGKLWLGTSGNGLINFNPDTEEFKIYTTDDGMPNNIVYGILVDEQDNLWLSTNMGLVKFYIISERFVAYDVKDGIQSYEFNLGSSYKGKDNTLYFGGMNGFNVFNPSQIKTNPNQPVIVITAFRKFNEIQPYELFDKDTIRLGYDDNFFSFEISALDYTNPANNKYQYFLAGFDKSWTTVDASNRIAEYKKVRPGHYTFYARGSNNDGIWNETGISIYIIINPPWYSSWAFRIAAGFIIVFVLWLIISRRIKRIRDKHRVEKKMLEIEKQTFELEQKALRLQMNPHFIFNSLNSIQSYILTHNTEMAVNYLGKFSRLMRLILANSGNNYVPFKEELKAICHYLDLEKLRFEDKFDYEVEMDKNIDQEFIEIPPMLIQPYIENAIIHGILHKKHKGKISLDFKLKGDNLYCSITDNGIGREKAAEIRESTGIKRKSSGMYITQARLEMLSKGSSEDFTVKITDLKDDTGKAKGTRVELLILFNED